MRRDAPPVSTTAASWFMQERYAHMPTRHQDAGIRFLVACRRWFCVSRV
ncbi:Uncharacterised protein [Mycobacteroides abscessus subsp. abscessus]|nr:Uncharacterised protein [Mycobacteroides abscessus subsp. abscessus]